MEITYENIVKWLDGYFNDVRKFQGDIEKVLNLKKYFTDDFDLTMYTPPSQPVKKVMSRDALLVSFVHPGLQENITPKYYVIDIKQMIAVVQFEIQFSDKPTRKKWNPVQASAHYHLKNAKNGDLIISKIQYWTERLPEGIMEIWAARRTEALTKLAVEYFNK
jgi:hypothetical protein